MTSWVAYLFLQLQYMTNQVSNFLHIPSWFYAHRYGFLILTLCHSEIVTSLDESFSKDSLCGQLGSQVVSVESNHPLSFRGCAQCTACVTHQCDRAHNGVRSLRWHCKFNQICVCCWYQWHTPSDIPMYVNYVVFLFFSYPYSFLLCALWDILG